MVWAGYHEDLSLSGMPLIHATKISVTNLEDTSDNPPQSVFENVFCLLRNTAEISYVPAHLLDPVIRGHKEEGFALMDIS